MPITDQQRALRRQHLGSSDVPAILGLDPWRSAYDVYLEKTAEFSREDEGNEYTEAGDLLEEGVLRWAERKIGKLKRNQYRVAKGLPFPLGANVDALATVDNDNPLDAKVSGLFNAWGNKHLSEWGAAGSDEVPERTIVQANVHMVCTGKELCHIAAALWGRGFVLFKILRNEAIIGSMMGACNRFWNENVEKRVPPTNSLPHWDNLRRIAVARPVKTISLPPKLIHEWRSAVDAGKSVETHEDNLKREVAALMGDAEVGDAADAGTVMFKEKSSGSRIDLEKLRTEFPEVAAKCTKPESTTREMRWKKPQD